MTTGELIEYLYRFNPRPRTGGDNLALSLPGAGAVSTHSDSPFSPDLGVSTHAPARGATVVYSNDDGSKDQKLVSANLTAIIQILSSVINKKIDKPSPQVSSRSGLEKHVSFYLALNC